MKRLLALIPFFAFAACGGIDIHIGEDANAQNASGAGGSGGNNEGCECRSNSGERLKAVFTEGEDGSRIQINRWMDSVIGDYCAFQNIPGRGTFCTPVHQPVNTYADSSCTVPVYMHVGGECTTMPDYVRFDRFDYANADTCSAPATGFEIYKVDAGHKLNGASAVWTIGPNGSCNVFVGGSKELYAIVSIGDEKKFVSGKMVP